jgi:hypothetical protein
MKSFFTITCGCGHQLKFEVVGAQDLKSAQCPSCHSGLAFMQPLGDFVGFRIFERAKTELTNGDYTLAILLSAAAVECGISYLFIKWNEIDVMDARMPVESDIAQWEEEWENLRSISARFERLAQLLVGQSFDAYIAQHPTVLSAVPSKVTDAYQSPKLLFMAEFFKRRNRIAHRGEINYSRSEGELCTTLAYSLFEVFGKMDAERLTVLDTTLAKRLHG